MDSYAESDPEAVVEVDVPEDPRDDDDRPHPNGDWYPDWKRRDDLITEALGIAPGERKAILVPEEFWPGDDS